MRKLIFSALLVAVGIGLNPIFSFSEEIRYDSGGRRDPFVPVKSAVAVSAQGQDVAVEGIIYSKSGASVVVIGGEPYKTGDKIGEQMITEIYQSYFVAKGKDGKTNEYWISELDKPAAK